MNSWWASERAQPDPTVVLGFSHFTLPRTPSNPAGLSSGTFGFSLHKRPHQNPPTSTPSESRWLVQRYLRFLTTRATVQEPQRTPSKSRWLVQRYLRFLTTQATVQEPQRTHSVKSRWLVQRYLRFLITRATAPETHPRVLHLNPAGLPSGILGFNYTSEGSEVSTGQAGGIILCAVSPRFSRNLTIHRASRWDS